MTWQTRGSVLLRCTVAGLLFIHGITRATNGTIGGFGEYLDGQHVPFGIGVAWLITGMEIAGTVALASGRFVIPLCAWFATVLTTGIFMAHAKNGWFVVGAGTGGVEYSVLLVSALATIAMLSKGAQQR